MSFTMPLDDVTVEDKLSAMELLWDDLCRTPEVIPSPAWHGDILQAREKRIRDSEAAFSSLDDVKDRFRKPTI